jgi:Fur family ferric uptake transcriptional regulator
MKYSEIKQALKNHKLRITDCRVDVLDLFIKKGKALSFKELEDELKEYDRVTLYRTLHSFTEKGVIHQIPDYSGSARYGICFNTCTAEAHHHNHIHFKCNHCGQLECLDSEILLPTVDLPEHYEIEEYDVVINGVCAECHAS